MDWSWRKRICSILLVGSMFAATACGGGDKEQTDGAAANQADSQAADSAEAESAAVYGAVGEIAADDAVNCNYTLDIDASDKMHDISDLLFGIFIEDINFAADGGLYAEMVQNRSFEFTQLAKGNEKHAWSDIGAIDATVVTDDETGCLNCNNPNYMVLTNASDEKAGIANCGFLDGMASEEGKNYLFSV